MVESQDLDVADVRLRVLTWESSDGPPVVLLHSLGESSSTWIAVAETLAEDHRVYAVDLRGHGDSSRTSRYSLDLMSEDVVGVIEHLGLADVRLIGHSLGGMIAYLIASRRVPRLAGLVLEEAPPPLPISPPRDIPTDPDQDYGFDWNALVALYAQRNNPDAGWWPALRAIEVPTLVLAGGPASHVDQGELMQMAVQIRSSEFVEIPVGHNIHADAPDEFVRTIRAFFAINGL